MSSHPRKVLPAIVLAAFTPIAAKAGPCDDVQYSLSGRILGCKPRSSPGQNGDETHCGRAGAHPFHFSAVKVEIEPRPAGR
jgi:hypothetical protein